MSIHIPHIELELDESLDEAVRARYPDYSSYRIWKRSVDARSGKPKLIYRLEVFEKGEFPPDDKIKLEAGNFKKPPRPVLVVGAGPAGLFCALRLAERGIPSIIFERGSKTVERLKAISRYWRYGKIDSENNVCFGEGGAGLYSDGKLITRIRSPHIAYVLDRLVQFGAPDEIKYLSNPHVGSDRIRKLIPPLRNFLISRGCQFFFDSKVQSLLIENDRCRGVVCADGREFRSDFTVLATGHSATDIILELQRLGVGMEGKSFAVGLRVEHSQSFIDKTQYKSAAGHPQLGAASYRLSCHDAETGIGVYSFCMCPGGYVIASSTDAEGSVSNGMSNFARNSPFANSAVVVSIDFEKNFGKELFGGMNFIRDLERKAKTEVTKAGGHSQLPGQSLKDFLNRRYGSLLKNSSPSGALAARLDRLFETWLYERLCEAFERFNRQLPGFISNEAQVFGVESRTSSPIRILRDKESLESTTHPGLYPAGEGAGYAGGITSAAVDGVRIAESIFNQLT